MRRNPLVVGFLALIGLIVVPVVLSAIVPIDSGGPAVLLPVAISTEPGDQFYARLDGNIATYIAQNGVDWQTGYYDFFTGDTKFVPQPPGMQEVIDYLPDISGNKIAFWRQEVNYPNISEAILVYDIATNATTEIKRIGPAPGYSGGFFYPAIGANTVAFVDLTVSGYGEVYVANLANLAAGPTRLTNNGGTGDDRIESTLRVAPSGNVVVGEAVRLTLLEIATSKRRRSTAAPGRWPESPRQTMSKTG